MKQTHRLASAAAALLVGVVMDAARAESVTRLASYETTETNLTVTANAGDPGLSISIVTGGQNGAPAATHGSRLLRVSISNEADRKVEFRHSWSGFTYDLAGNDAIRADVYVTSAASAPGVIGLYDANWNPPSPWQPGAPLPTAGAWVTVSFNISNREQVGLNRIWAFVLENLATTSGVIYVDNLRLVGPGGAPLPRGVAALGLPASNEVHWTPTGGVAGYHVYRATSSGGPYEQLTTAPIATTVFVDPQPEARPEFFYRITAVADGEESAPSDAAVAQYNGLTDDELLDLVQEATFRYFWDYGHPKSGLARESNGLGHPSSTVTTGGSGFGLLTIIVGAERGFVTRAAAAERMLRIVRFLDGVDPDNTALPSGVQRYHGAWSHWMNGQTGATIAFAGAADNGGDLVETAFMIEGLLAVRQYFDDPADPVESEIRDRCTSMWEAVEWDWYQRTPGSNVLYWHWSPNFGWQLNHPIRGYNEAQIVYILAASSPTHPVPSSVYHFGWVDGNYENGASYYGIPLPVGPAFGGPLFFTHYSNLGLDPRYQRDAYANYFRNAQAASLINRAYCTDNPQSHAGYSPLLWGLTASFNPFGYSAHSPTNDNGTITPTAAISAMPYTPHESLRALRYMYDAFGDDLFGFYGFRDALNLNQNWFAPGWLAIDQGTIAPMIENYRSGLCWRLFMQNPEIRAGLTSIGVFYEVDFDFDGDVDLNDVTVAANCTVGPDATTVPPGCTPQQFADADLDDDGDVDLADAAIVQQIFTGP